MISTLELAQKLNFCFVIADPNKNSWKNYFKSLIKRKGVYHLLLRRTGQFP